MLPRQPTNRLQPMQSMSIRNESNEDRLNLSMTPKQPPLFNGIGYPGLDTKTQ